MTAWLPVVSRELCAERLQKIFPRAGFDAVFSSPGAATVVASMIYVGAVEDPTAATPRYVRPSTIYLLREAAVSGHTSDEEREQYYRAAVGTRPAHNVDELMRSWGINEGPWYDVGTRETLRDDILRRWHDDGPVIRRADVATTSSKPTWLLRRSFAELFDPSLDDDDLQAAIDGWVASEMSANGRMRAETARAVARSGHAVIVTLPTGESRQLAPGEASGIVKGVVELWAPKRLNVPLVISISEPGAKIAVADDALLRRLGISINVSTLLPDAMIVDGGPDPVEVWVIEVVHSDGPIDEARKVLLTEWAERQGIASGQLRFLTAFLSRNASPAKRRLKDLASGSYAWFLAEPDQELYFGPIEVQGEPQLAAVTPIRRG